MIEDKFADEMLTDEELDKVTGGSSHETVNDSVFLNLIGLLDESYTFNDIDRSGTREEEKVKAAFAQVGIEFVYYEKAGEHNHYYYKNKTFKQDEAWAFAMLMAEEKGLGKYKK